MRRRWVIVGGLAIAAFVAAYVVTTRADDDDDPPAAVELEGLDDLSVEARDLVSLADRGGEVPHHAVYEQPPDARFEVWTDGTRVREETTGDDGDRRVLLRTPDEAVDCVEADGEWSCEEVEARPDAVASISIQQLAVDLVGAEVAISDGTIAGEDVRCYEVTGTEAPTEICLTLDGVLARLGAGTERLELVSLDSDVDDDRFDRPD